MQDKPIIWGKQIGPTQATLYVNTADDRPMTMRGPDDSPTGGFPLTANINSLIAKYGHYNLQFYKAYKEPANENAVCHQDTPEFKAAMDAEVRAILGDVKPRAATPSAAPASKEADKSLLEKIEGHLSKLKFAFSVASRTNAKILQSKIETIEELLNVLRP